MRVAERLRDRPSSYRDAASCDTVAGTSPVPRRPDSSPAIRFVASRSGLCVGAILAMATPAYAQQAQNPSPMSDTTRPHPRVAESRAAGERATLSLGELFVPAAAAARKQATMPLVVHFHGTPWLIEQHVARSAPHAALITVNLGAGSGRYAAPFADAATFAALLDEAADATARITGRRPTWSSVTLTSWSAGYGAVRAILAQPDMPHASTPSSCWTACTRRTRSRATGQRRARRIRRSRSRTSTSSHGWPPMRPPAGSDSGSRIRRSIRARTPARRTRPTPCSPR